MEKYFLDKDITVFGVDAVAFPQGIGAAHQQLHALVAGVNERQWIAVSRPAPNKTIHYKAATAELYPGEAAVYGLTSVCLRKGWYIKTVLVNWQQQERLIGAAFEKLLEYPGIDPEGYCVEWYQADNTLLCMVRLSDGDH